MLTPRLENIALSSVCFFNLASRLARFTGNETYALYAEKAWNWLYDVEFINHNNWRVSYGAHIEQNCTDISRLVRCGEPAALALGAAYMFNHVSLDKLPLGAAAYG